MISPSSFSNTSPPTPSVASVADHYTTANPASLYDATLVRRFKGGDESAFDEIVNRHRAKLHSLALGHLHNHADAEEIAQDACIHAYRGLAGFRGESSLASWLYRIVFNLSRNRCSYYSCRHSPDTCSLNLQVDKESHATIADFIASNAPDPAREESNRDFLVLVEACMEKLPPRQREILALRNTVGHSYGQIARILRIRPGTVKSRIARARNGLRTQLAQADGNTDSIRFSSFFWFVPAHRLGHLIAVSC